MAGRAGAVITEQVSQAQIDALGDRMDKGFDEIKGLLRPFEERLRGLENREAGCSPLINSRLTAAWAKIDEHAVKLSKLQEALQSMSETAKFLNTVARWLLGIITTVAIALIIAVLTGKIDIVVR